jgi:hypothetical protein
MGGGDKKFQEKVTNHIILWHHGLKRGRIASRRDIETFVGRAEVDGGNLEQLILGLAI